MERHNLAIQKKGTHAALFLDGMKLKFVEKYRIEEDSNHATLTVTLDVDKNISFLTEE